MLKKVAVRSLVLAVVYAAAVLVVNATDTTDPLGPGLLLFLAFVLIGLVWGGFDGRRSGGQSVLVWLAASALGGVLVALESVLMVDEVSTQVADFLGTVALVVLLVWLPALVGTALGVLARRLTS